MSWTSRVLELVRMGMSQADAYAFVAKERIAMDAGEPAVELPAKVLEKYYGQYSLFARRVQNTGEAA